ncbi:MAG: RuBisCO large subunit C-terminal-like domain-containing protein [Mahellales bacterium]|jgi:2,3-diketo-5-methylthiopentyl-1-phosphate enolase
MRQYYYPEIFNNTIDSVDRKRNIIATYYMRDRKEGLEFKDHLALVQSLALESSTGTWEKVDEDTEEVRETLSCKLVGYYQIPNEDKYVCEAVIQFAMSIDAWIDNVPMMLLSIAGNAFAYSDFIRLVDISIPDDLLNKFKGPKFGINGLRELIGVKERRPLSLHIIKPKMGMTPQQTAQQCYQTAIGGVDLIKDDEMCSDTYNSKFTDRIKYVMEALHKAKEKTGKMPIYLCSITHEVEKLHDRARKAVESGGNGLLITYSAGLSSFKAITEDPDINVPVMMHGSHMIAGMHHISWPVFGKLCRLCGADLMLTPTIYSSIPMVSHEEGLRTAQVKLAPWKHIKQTAPMPCAGVYPGTAPIIIGEYGPDIVIPAGGGMLGHPDGYTAGAKAWQQAIKGSMETETDEQFVEFAKRPENHELKRALEKWGMPKRPAPQWLRASEALRPKPMKMD